MNLKNLLIVATLLATFCGISACDSIYETVKPIQGDGNLITQTRIAEGFSGIELEGAADVTVYPSESYEVVVKTDANLQEQIVTEVRNNVLHISMKQGSISPTELMVEVHLPALQNMKISGSGDIKINSGEATNMAFAVSGSGNIDAADFQVETATVEISGSGDLNIWATKLLRGKITGSGNIDALKAEVESAEIKISGSGEARVWVTKTLNGNISGSGDILYKGNPVVAVDVTGSGSVKPL